MHIGGETSQIYEICKEAKKGKLKLLKIAVRHHLQGVYGTKIFLM